MRHTVVWRAEALADLARLWNTAVDRQSIAKAADLIDDYLATNPALLEKTGSGTSRVDRPAASRCL